MVMPAAAAVVDPSAAVAPAASPTTSDQHPLQAHDLLPIILSFTIEKDCRDLGKCLQVSKTWNDIGQGDLVWQQACKTSFKLTKRVTPEMAGSGCEAASSYYKAWKAWDSLRGSLGLHHGQLDATLWMRVHSLWSRLESWYGVHCPAIAATFNPAATAAQWDDYLQETVGERAGEVRGRPASLALQYLYTRHNGQGIPGHSRPRGLGDLVNGMFGGYSAYDHLVCSVLCPLDMSAKYRAALRGHDLIPEDWLVLAFDYRVARAIVVDTVSGNLHVVTRYGRQPACPPLGTDSLVQWLETFVDRLEGGVYAAARLLPDEDGSRGVSLFPLKGPEVSVAVTRGIRVTAHPLYMPEHSQGWTYSIRIKLLSPGEQGYLTPQARGFTTAQLRSRHWEVNDGQGNVEHVRGNGVIGKYPLIKEGGWRDDEDNGYGEVQEGNERVGEFVYQSCSGRGAQGRGSFGGDLTFVPGSIDQPAGAEFHVTVARFPLSIPEWVY